MGKNRGSGHKKRGGNPEQNNQAKPKGQTPRNKRSKGQRKQPESQGVGESNEQVTDPAMTDFRGNIDYQNEFGVEAMETDANDQSSAEVTATPSVTGFRPGQVPIYDDSENRLFKNKNQQASPDPRQREEYVSAESGNQGADSGSHPSSSEPPSLSDLAGHDQKERENERKVIIRCSKTEQPITFPPQFTPAPVENHPPSSQEIVRTSEMEGQQTYEGEQSPTAAQQADYRTDERGDQQTIGGQDPFHGSHSQAIAQQEHGEVAIDQSTYDIVSPLEALRPEDFPEYVHSLQLANQKANDDLERMAKEKQTLEQRLETSESQMRHLHDENTNNLEKVNQQDLQITQLQSSESNKMKNIKHELDTKQKETKQQKQQINSHEEVIKKQWAALKEKEEVNQSLSKRFSEKQVEFAAERSKLNDELNEYKRNLDWYANTYQQMQAHMGRTTEEHKQEKLKLQRALNDAEDECKSLSLRLSKFAGAQLVYNNPNIADLSDAFRPTKLGEMFSELYDNEWTDSFEELHSNKKLMTEVDTTQYMMQLLKRAYDLCKEITTSHMTSITKSITSVTVTMDVRRPKPGPNAQKSDSNRNGASCKDTDASQQAGTDLQEPMVSKSTVSQESEEDHKNSDNIQEALDAKENLREESELDYNAKSMKQTVEAEQQGNDGRDDGSSSANPTETANNPAKTEDNPTKTADNPTKTADNATETEDNAAETGDNPIETDNNTTKTGDNTTETGHTPTKTGDNTNARSPEGQSNAPDNKTSRDNGAEGDTVPETDSKAIPEDNKTSRDSGAGAEGDTVPESDSKVISEEVQTESGNSVPAADDVDRVEEEQCLISIDEDRLSIEQKKQIADLRKFAALELQDEVLKKLQEKIMTEKNLDTTYPNTVIYIQSCVKLCWMMCLHKPPVVIGFIEAKDDTPFEKDKFKEYTKTGKWLDFVVWPPLYLFEGGAMLCKGTAQGRKGPK